MSSSAAFAAAAARVGVLGPISAPSGTSVRLSISSVLAVCHHFTNTQRPTTALPAIGRL